MDRRLLVVLMALAAVLATPAPGLGEPSGGQLEIRSAKVRLHRERGVSRDRMKVQAYLPMLEQDYDPRRDSFDFLVAGIEVLCGPGEFEPLPSADGDPDESPPLPRYYSTPIDPPQYGPPGTFQPATPRVWTLEERDDGSVVFRARGRRVDLDPLNGTITLSGRDLDLDFLPEVGPGAVDLALALGNEQFGTVIDFEARGRAWRYSGR